MGYEFFGPGKITEINEQKLVEQKYYQWKKGEIDFSEYSEFCIYCIGNYIRKRMREYAQISTTVDHEDHMQNAICGILQKLREYDPEKGKLTTYFTPTIIEYLTGKPSKDESKHYSYIVSVLNKTAQKYGFTDASDPALKPTMLAKLCDSRYSVTTIVNALEYDRSNNVCSFEAVTENNDFGDNSLIGRNPLTQVCDMETSSELQQALDKCCTSFEKFLIQELVLATDKPSYRMLVMHLKDPADPCYKGTFTDDEICKKNVVDKNYLEKRYSLVMMRLQQNQSVKKCAGNRMKATLYVPEDEQASFDDLNESFDEGLLFEEAI